MMQSAAVLPTESPVKSLPEILGVPLQRKTFFCVCECVCVFCYLVFVSAARAAGFRYSKRGG